MLGACFAWCVTIPESAGPPSAGRERWAARPRSTLAVPAGEVWSVAWGELRGRAVLASCGSGGIVRLWDPERAQELPALPGVTREVFTVAWGDLFGRPVLAGGAGNGTVRLWDPQLERELPPLVGGGDGGTSSVRALAWGRLARRPALASGEATVVRLWDPDRAQELGTLPEGSWDLAWGELGDGRPVLATCLDGAVRLWDPEQRQELARLTGHSGSVFALAWGRLDERPVLASGGDDGTVRLWDPADGRQVALLRGDGGTVHALAWAQLGGQPVLASTDDSRVWLWDPERGRQLTGLTGHSSVVMTLAWGQLDQRPVLVTGGGSDKTVRVWDPVIERFEDRLPGYRADDPGDPDRLGRDGDAAALAEMITARSARPPLAIGLFGNWGEGKTHFLRQIADHVDRLATTAKSDPDDRLTYSAVRQIRFNAWHYAETDLWASLVAELFSQMAEGPDDRGEEERRQSRLAAELAARRQLPERLRAAQERQQALRAELEKSSGRPWTLPLRLDPRQRAQLTALAGDQPEQLYQDMREAASGIGGTARLAWQVAAAAARRPWFWLGLLLAAAAIALGLVTAVPLGRSLGAAAGLVTLLGTTAGTVRRSVTEIKDRAGPVVEQVQRYAENRRRRLQTALEVATAQVDALQAELQALTPTGQLTALIERRGGRDSPYRAQLGLMTQIREDFEQMATLLAASPLQPPAKPDLDAVGDELPQIDRIVVYIDDLDRCPPERVVQVLEAVQLLLAVPLFVVVVAVDPRWLLRSLTIHYQELWAGPPDAADQAGWESTPMQYLEKIFQIPFTLPPVDHAGYVSLVDALTAPGPRADRPDPGEAVTTGAESPSPAASAPSPGASSPAQAPPPLPAVPVVQRFDPLALTDDERRLITLLGPQLITTPRSIKRLVNSYGLLNALRGSRHETDLAEAVHAATGGTYRPYRAAIVLLGVLIAFPDLSPVFFRLLYENGAGTWPQFLKRICPEHHNGVWGSELLDALAGQADALRWRRLIGMLERLTVDAAAAALPLPEPLEAWVEWVVPVGRLSFETGHSVINLSSPE